MKPMFIFWYGVIGFVLTVALYFYLIAPINREENLRLDLDYVTSSKRAIVVDAGLYDEVMRGYDVVAQDAQEHYCANWRDTFAKCYACQYKCSSSDNGAAWMKTCALACDAKPFCKELPYYTSAVDCINKNLK